ncbi:hypothetical protein HY212_05040 [Candidatus Pacearchaeota archaeon]|nr:hypothetical protein [Candidatus Pacearchaeota archaeon]
MTLKQRIKELSTKTKIGLATLAVATLVGTIGGSEGVPPFYNVKEGTSYGINIGIVNRFKKDSKHYGINIGAFNVYDGATINGCNFELLDTSAADKEDYESVNGLEVGLFNFDMFSEYSLRGHRINGAQIGLGNVGHGNFVQLDFLGKTTSKEQKRTTFGLNWRFEK